MVFKINKAIVSVFVVVILLLAAILIIDKNETVTIDSTAVSKSIPIVMYHHITKYKNKTNAYTLHVNELENDLIWLKSNGYETIVVEELIEYVSGTRSLPEKVIMLTFDDGFESVYKLAFPLLKKYNMKAVVSVIGKQADIYTKNNDHNINYSNLNWSQIKQLSDEPLIEIQNHTYNMHMNDKGKRKGIAKLKNESQEKYKKTITEDITKMQSLLKKKTGKAAKAFVFPYGAYNSSTLTIIKDIGFKCTLTCEEKISTVYQGNPDSLYQLGRFNRPSGIGTEEFFTRHIEVTA